ncbi:uncharacterized protein [Cherax quadricarinatus]|uniref:uncharacterized protein n=1 Tax=Cherax quadricarinatus TaxID=27406 RepID=UPI002379E3C8|nr:uncharacterized protein LOC128700868 isoform X2 [Cherax quadricarinatus]XP_053650304.1 uncharacterized protein LOC128700868 isoform X2 [Cherax quadricarinatus]XP_053650305.1 uncharacterized protein LOC128700868 isoform X2 [Cherax quadricarinatus]
MARTPQMWASWRWMPPLPPTAWRLRDVGCAVSDMKVQEWWEDRRHKKLHLRGEGSFPGSPWCGELEFLDEFREVAQTVMSWHYTGSHPNQSSATKVWRTPPSPPPRVIPCGIQASSGAE